MDRFEEMQTFIRVAETLSVTRASMQMGIAASAISRRVKDLESRLGVQLMRRSTRRITLTDAGRTYYERCVRIVADMEEADCLTVGESARLTGTLRIAIPTSLAQAELNAALGAFMELHPSLLIEADISDRRVDLVGEGMDLAIRVGTLRDSSLIARRLCDIRHVVCASPAFLARHGTPHSLDDLSKLPALCYGNIHQPANWPFRHPDGSKGVLTTQYRMIATSGETLRMAAIGGLGIACEPSFIVHEQIAEGSLVPVLTEYDWFGMSIYAVYPPTRHLSARARAFIDFLIDRIGPEPRWERCLG